MVMLMLTLFSISTVSCQHNFTYIESILASIYIATFLSDLWVSSSHTMLKLHTSS